MAGWFVKDIAKLSKKFETRKVALGANFKAEQYNIKFNNMLKEWYMKESLNLIGAFQDGSDLKLLLFKLDKQPTQDPELFTEIYQPAAGITPEDQRREIENLIN